MIGPNLTMAAEDVVNQIQNGVNETATNVGINSTKSPEELAGKIINTILAFLGVIFLALTIYAGFLWMTAGGEEKKITTAKGILKSSITGLIIILAAYLLVNFVIFTLIGKNLWAHFFLFAIPIGL